MHVVGARVFLTVANVTFNVYCLMVLVVVDGGWLPRPFSVLDACVAFIVL